MSANAIRTVAVLSFLVAGGLMPRDAAAQTPQRVTGTTVTMTPPPGFTPAKEFSGFADEATKSSILIAELPPQAWPQLSALFGNINTVRAGFKQKGIEVTTLDKVPTAAGEAFLAAGTQTAAGAKLAKWVALAQGSRTVMITVQAMDGAKLDDAAIKAMLKTVSLGEPASEVEKLASLPFTVAPAAPFRVIDTMGGTGVAMTVGEKNVDPKAEQPLLIVSSQVSGGPVGSAAALATAKALLKQTREMESASIDTEKKVKFGGTGDGVLLEGKAGENKRFVQYFATGPKGNFVRLVAFYAADRSDEIRPAIEKVAASVAIK